MPQTWEPGGSTRRKQGMRRIVVSLLKGGVAKSETSVSLAHGLALAGLKVLLVDTDVQAQCNDMLGLVPQRGLADVIAKWCHPFEALAEARDNLWLLAGGNDLAAVKMEIARREMSPEAVLDEALEPFDKEFDVMVMDTAPGWDTLLVNALYCSREVLSPVSMEPVALSGLMRFEERLQIIQKYNPLLTLRWIVPTFVDGRVRKTEEIMAQLLSRYGERVAPGIKYSVKLSEAPAFGRTIYEHDPKGVAAQCYRALTQKVLDDGPLAGVALAAAPRIAPVIAPLLGEQLLSVEDKVETPLPVTIPPATALPVAPVIALKPAAETEARPASPPFSPANAPTTPPPPRPMGYRPPVLSLGVHAQAALKERLKETDTVAPRALDSALKELRRKMGQDGRA